MLFIALNCAVSRKTCSNFLLFPSIFDRVKRAGNSCEKKIGYLSREKLSSQKTV